MDDQDIFTDYLNNREGLFKFLYELGIRTTLKIGNYLGNMFKSHSTTGVTSVDDLLESNYNHLDDPQYKILLTKSYTDAEILLINTFPTVQHLINSNNPLDNRVYCNFLNWLFTLV